MHFQCPLNRLQHDLTINYPKQLSNSNSLYIYIDIYIANCFWNFPHKYPGALYQANFWGFAYAIFISVSKSTSERTHSSPHELCCDPPHIIIEVAFFYLSAEGHLERPQKDQVKVLSHGGCALPSACPLCSSGQHSPQRSI